jgi:hypothetical protein
MEKHMDEGTRAKDSIRALLDRLPDDCNLESVIEEILLLDGPWLTDSALPPLTEEQRAALVESIAHHRRHPEARTPWRQALERIGRGR